MNHTVAVTSGTRDTGKTTSVAILGAVFADLGVDVLLVDCDFTDPSLAADLGIAEPDATIRDVFAGRATLEEAAHTGSAGVAVLPGARLDAPDAAGMQCVVDAIDGFGLVICDTGHPFTDATTGVCDAADGIVVVSTSDSTARRNAAAVHQSLRDHERPLLGTALTRVENDADSTDWDCEPLATIPESDVVADGGTTVLDSPSDPGAESYQELARGVFRRLRDGHDGTASNSRRWLPHPADPFLTPSVSDGRSSASDSHSEDRIEESDSDAGDNDTPSRTVLVTDGGSDSALDANDSAAEADTTPEEPDEHDGSEIKLTRRGALAAITAAVGGVSAGILSTRETPHIEAFGYGGAPVSSNESENADATNGTTSAGALPTAGINRTEPTTETGSGDTEPDPSGNGTETGGTGNTTDPASTGNTTETNDELAPGAAPTNGTGDDASSDAGESPTAGGGSGGNTGGSSGGENTADGDGTTGGGDTGTGGDGNTGSGDTGTGDDGSTESGDSGTGGDGTGSDDGDTGTGGDGTGSDDGGDGTDDTTDSPSDPSDEQFGTVGYGEGGYGGVA